MKTLTFLSRQAPFGSSRAKACMDMVLASAVFEQQINYVFMDDGVWQLVKGHAPEGSGAKNSLAALQALELMVSRTSMRWAARWLSADWTAASCRFRCGSAQSRSWQTLSGNRMW